MHQLPFQAFVTAAVLWICAATACAQTDTSRVVRDTAATSTVDTSSLGTEGYRMTKSPLVATTLSFIPGAGQIYNEQYIKAAVFVGVGGFFIGQALWYNQRFVEKAAEVDAIPLDDSTGLRRFRRDERERYRDNRDLNVAYFIGVQILSMIDAYVGAHLFDFDVDGSEDGLSSRLYLDPQRMGVGVLMRW